MSRLGVLAAIAARLDGCHHASSHPRAPNSAIRPYGAVPATTAGCWMHDLPVVCGIGHNVLQICCTRAMHTLGMVLQLLC